MKKLNAMLFCNSKEVFETCKKKLARYETVFLISTNYELKSVKINEKTAIVFIPFDSEHLIFFDETWKIIENINKIVNTIKLNKSSYLYEVCNLIEGGFAQDISDILYAIYVFLKLIKNKEINVFFCEKKCSVESNALKCIAKQFGNKLYFIEKNKKSLPEIKCNIDTLNVPILRDLINLKIQLASVINVVKIWKSNKVKKENERIYNYDIGIIHTSNANKHINWQLEGIKSYECKMDYCVFCYHADVARKKMKECGKNTKSVEAYFAPEYLLGDYIAFLRDTYKISQVAKKIDNIEFQNINITQWIVNNFLNDLKRKKFENVIYERIINRFVVYNRALLLTGDGDTNFISNRIFYSAYKKSGIAINFYKDTTGIETINVEAERVYEPFSYIMNIRFFSKGSTYLKVLRENGWKGKDFLVPPSIYNLNSKDVLMEVSRKEKKAPVVLWAPSYPLRGHYSINSFLLDNKFILDEFTKQDCELYIKYHPNQALDLINNYIDEYLGMKKVHFVDKAESIEKYIKKADIIITTPSTVLLDAAWKNRPVICLTDSCSYQLVKHLSRGFIISKRSKINVCWLFDIFNDLDERNKWIKKCVHRQNSFLKQFYTDTEWNDIYSVLKMLITDGISK